MESSSYSRIIPLSNFSIESIYVAELPRFAGDDRR